jgi:hypothetical protein
LANIPKEFLLYAVQAYKAHPVMNMGYKKMNGGLGKVTAIMTAQLILMAQARTSMTNLI